MKAAPGDTVKTTKVRNTSEKGPVIVGELELVVALDAGDFGVGQARPISYRPVAARGNPSAMCAFVALT
jgi:hypothetical protein